MVKRHSGYFKGVKCHKCGGGTTYVYHGSPKWYNDIDKNGDLIGKICSSCYRNKRKDSINDTAINTDNIILVDIDEVIKYSISRSSVKEKRKCSKCGSEDTYISPVGPQWCKYYDENGRWDGKSWLCKKCYLNKYYNKFIKPTYKCRNKELPKDSTKGKGFRGEQIFVKARGAKNCNIEMDNFNFVYDVYDEEYGKTQVKARMPYCGDWHFSGINPERKNVIRIYIIPSECINSKKIAIMKSPHPSIGSKWEEFRIEDIKVYNDAYHNMSIEDCSVLKDG